MPKNVQALACIYQEYWNKRDNWVGYKEFYAIYKQSLSHELEEWRKKCRFSEETFYIGLPARIYRTWASILTQIQGGYVAETIYGKSKVEISVNQDRKGKDMVIDMGKAGRMPIQIKKLSNRVEAQRKANADKGFIEILYAVPPSSPFTKTGKPSKPYNDWVEAWGDKLERLDNGFVIFKRRMFELETLLRSQSLVE